MVAALPKFLPLWLLLANIAVLFIRTSKEVDDNVLNRIKRTCKQLAKIDQESALMYWIELEELQSTHLHYVIVFQNSPL